MRLSVLLPLFGTLLACSRNSSNCPDADSGGPSTEGVLAKDSGRSVETLVQSSCAYRQLNDDYDYLSLEFAIPLREENEYTGTKERVEFFAISCGLNPPGIPNPARYKCNGARTELTAVLNGSGFLGGPVPLTDYAGVDFRAVRRAGAIFTIKSEVHPFPNLPDVTSIEIKVNFAEGTITYLEEATKGTQVFRTTKGSTTCTTSNWPPGVPYWKRK